LLNGLFDFAHRNWNLGVCRFTSLQAHDDVVLSVLLRGSWVMTGSLDATVKVWDLATLEPVTTLRGHKEGVVSLASNSTSLISGSYDQSVLVWDSRSFEIRARFEGHTRKPSSLLFCFPPLVPGG